MTSCGVPTVVAHLLGRSAAHRKGAAWPAWRQRRAHQISHVVAAGYACRVRETGLWINDSVFAFKWEIFQCVSGDGELASEPFQHLVGRE